MPKSLLFPYGVHNPSDLTQAAKSLYEELSVTIEDNHPTFAPSTLRRIAAQYKSLAREIEAYIVKLKDKE